MSSPESVPSSTAANTRKPTTTRPTRGFPGIRNRGRNVYRDFIGGGPMKGQHSTVLSCHFVPKRLRECRLWLHVICATPKLMKLKPLPCPIILLPQIVLLQSKFFFPSFCVNSQVFLSATCPVCTPFLGYPPTPVIPINKAFSSKHPSGISQKFHLGTCI